MPLKKQTKRRRRYSVTARLNVFELPKTGSCLTLTIKSGKAKLGELSIGRGSVQWLGRNQQKSKRFSWKRFAELLDKAK